MVRSIAFSIISDIQSLILPMILLIKNDFMQILTNNFLCENYISKKAMYVKLWQREKVLTHNNENHLKLMSIYLRLMCFYKKQPTHHGVTRLSAWYQYAKLCLQYNISYPQFYQLQILLAYGPSTQHWKNFDIQRFQKANEVKNIAM